jgi:uncharacterized protein (DUF1778 family)
MPDIAEVNIHLRARVRDRDLIDRAAELAGTNRSHFMLASALKEAKTLLLDQATIQVDRAAFNKILAWMDAEPSADEVAGIKRFIGRKPDWARG